MSDGKLLHTVGPDTENPRISINVTLTACGTIKPLRADKRTVKRTAMVVNGTLNMLRRRWPVCRLYISTDTLLLTRWHTRSPRYFSISKQVVDWFKRPVTGTNRYTSNQPTTVQPQTAARYASFSVTESFFGSAYPTGNCWGWRACLTDPASANFKQANSAISSQPSTAPYNITEAACLTWTELQLSWGQVSSSDSVQFSWSSHRNIASSG